jgi:LPS sulfotransferase NodH
MLRATGRAGRPLEHFETLRHSSLPRQPREYFDGADLPDLPEVLELLAAVRPGAPSSESAEAWWERIVGEGSTPNGVWGGKLMWGHVDELLARARELHGLSGADLEAVLRALLGEPRLIFVTRADKVAQAVSLWRALQTQSWRADDSVRHAEPRYVFAGIDYLLGQLRDDERAWKSWFASSSLGVPIHVRYEELDAAPQGTVARVLDALGLHGVSAPAPPLSRQRDEISSSWAERYRRDLERVA